MRNLFWPLLDREISQISDQMHHDASAMHCSAWSYDIMISYEPRRPSIDWPIQFQLHQLVPCKAQTIVWFLASSKYLAINGYFEMKLAIFLWLVQDCVYCTSSYIYTWQVWRGILSDAANRPRKSPVGSCISKTPSWSRDSALPHMRSSCMRSITSISVA